jgi:hypothetical protein
LIDSGAWPSLAGDMAFERPRQRIDVDQAAGHLDAYWPSAAAFARRLPGLA